MLHHYNYPTTLSHFLNYHHLDDQNSQENGPKTPNMCEDFSQEDEMRCRSNSSINNNKSFTIAAILGLNSENKNVGKNTIHINFLVYFLNYLFR